MYMKISQNLVLCTCFLFLMGAKAQDAQFSQFYAAPVLTNPAATGAAVCGRYQAARFGLNYSKQLIGAAYPSKLMAASWDQRIGCYHSGIGIVVLNDVAFRGFVKNRTVAASYSYMIPFNRNRLFMRFGVQGAFSFRTLSFDRIIFDGPPINFYFPNGEEKPSKTIHYPNLNAGWLLYNKKFFVGIAVHNILTPNWSFYNSYKDNIRVRYTLHAGREIPLSKCGKNEECKYTFSPNLIMMNQGEAMQFNLGFNSKINHLILGSYFKQTLSKFNSNNAVSVLLGYRKNDMQCLYSLDFPTSQSRSMVGLAHEVSLSFNLSLPPTRKPHIPTRTPEF